MSKLAEEVGARVLSLREAAGYSQRGLGDLVGVSHNAIGKVERGLNVEIGYEFLDRVSHAFGIEPADLFNFPWSEQTIPWRHIARELIRFTPSEELKKLVTRIEQFSAVRLTDVMEAAAAEGRRRR